jgi:tRNA/tmRNA/rRNA uracil-C5-methylase (TrmA/RlmC/RlmD family)
MARKRQAPRDQPFPYHTEIELEISTLTNRGLGLGRVGLPGAAEAEADGSPGGGWVVMVPFTLPGERVRARVYRNHANFSEADLVAVLRPAPERVEPRCPLFGRCGGCQYQHFDYAAQLVWKQRQVAELLEHMAGLRHVVAPVIGSPRPYGYRSKLTPHFNLPRDPAAAAGAPVGFLRQGTRHDLVDVPACPIATDAINAVLPPLRAEVRGKLAAGDYRRGATLLLRDANGRVTTAYDEVIEEVVPGVGPGDGPLRLRFLARDFFQNNPFLLPAFVRHVRAQAAAGGARYLVDAYCGSGLFALGAAPAFARVVGIEISATAVEFATANARANGLAHAEFHAGSAEAIFAGLDFPPAATAVIIDPPRKGCDEVFLRQLFAYGPARVVYVSCDPATQMRDLRHFLAAGYAVTEVQPFDLFPQTRHLECVITLVKEPAP